MRIFLKFMNAALWSSFITSLVVFFGFLAAYLFSGADTMTRATMATSLAIQGIMFCVVWGLILWSMHDREKQDKEYKRLMHEIKQEGERFKAEMKALRNQKCNN